MNLSETKNRMEQTLSLLQKHLTGIGDNVSIQLVSNIKITDSTGQKIPIDQLALVGKKDNSILISVFDPQNVSNIEKTLKQSGFNVYIFSKREVVVSIPPPSGEESLKIITFIKKCGEEAKISLRNIRKKYKQTNPDEDMKVLDGIMNLYTSKLDSIVSHKIGR